MVGVAGQTQALLLPPCSGYPEQLPVVNNTRMLASARTSQMFITSITQACLSKMAVHSSSSSSPVTSFRKNTGGYYFIHSYMANKFLCSL